MMTKEDIIKPSDGIEEIQALRIEELIKRSDAFADQTEALIALIAWTLLERDRIERMRGKRMRGKYIRARRA